MFLCVAIINWDQVLPRGHFTDLANHVICGDQVIVRGEDMVTVTSLLMVLKVIFWQLVD